jgi:hypothetical protein
LSARWRWELLRTLVARPLSNRWFNQCIGMVTAAVPIARSTNGAGMNDGKRTASGIITDGKNAVTVTTRIHDIRDLIMRAFCGLLLLLLVAGSVSGCVVEEPGGWGWHHHHHDDY